MAGAPRLLAGLLALSLSLTLAPAALAAPPQPWALSGAPEGAFRVDLAPVPGSGALVVSVLGPHELQFYRLGEDGLGTASLTSAFAIEAERDDAPLSCARVAVLSEHLAAAAYSQAGVVKAMVVDPSSGVAIADLALGSSASQPCAVVGNGEFWVSFLERGGAGASVVVVRIAPSGEVADRVHTEAAGVASAALVAAVPVPLLAMMGTSSIAVLEVSEGSLSPLGAFSIAATAGALWARSGSLFGLFSTGAGLVRTVAPVDDPSAASTAAVVGPSNALDVAAVSSADGMLLAGVASAASTTVLREDAREAYASSALAGVRSVAVATDGFGLARAALLRASSAGTSVQTLTAGDADAVSIAVDGAHTFLPAERHTFTATVRAVRSDITLVGLDVAPPPGWAVLASGTTVAVARGASATLSFTLTAPAGTPAGLYAATVRPAVVEAPLAAAAALDLEVLRAALVAPVGATSSVDLAPGGSTTVSVTLLNRGGSPVLAEVVPTVPDGFLVTPPLQATPIAPGASVQVSFVVTAGQGSSPVDDAAISLRLTTGGADAPTVISLPATIRAVFAPEFAAPPADLSALPGSSVAVPVSLLNRGNAGGLVALAFSSDGPLGTNLAGATPLVFVPAFGQVDVPVSLHVPEGARAGSNLGVTVAASIASDGSPIGVAASYSGNVLAALAFSVGASGASAAPGEDAQLTLTLANAGNAPVIADLELPAFADGFAVRALDGTTGGILVAPASTRTVALAVRVPTTALPGPHSFEATVRAVPGGSLGAVFAVDVLPVHALALSVLAPPPPLASPDIDAASFEFAVSNPGNTPAEVRLEFAAALLSLSQASDTGVFGPATLPLTVAPFGSTTLRARVSTDFAPHATSSSTRVTAYSAAGVEAFATVAYDRLDYDAAVSDLAVRSISGEPLVGSLHTASFRVATVGPGTATGLFAVLHVDGAILARVALPAITPGPSRLFQFDVVPHSPDTTYTVTLVQPSYSLDRDGGNDAIALHYAATPRAAEPQPLPRGTAPAAAASISVIALLALALSEIGKSTLITAVFLPLYVKLKPDEVLDQYLRGQIHGYIIANPGEHYNAIKDQLGVTNGALAYHLRVLERAELIRAVRDGMYKRFYPVGMKIPKRKRLSPFQAAIVRAVRSKADVSQKELADILGVSNQVVNYNVKLLEDANVLKVDRSARASKVTLGPDAPPAEEPSPAFAPAPAP